MSIFDKGFFKKGKKASEGVAVGSISFDINRQYSTYAQRYAAANSAMRASPFMRGNLISIEESQAVPGEIEYVVKASGLRSSNLEDAAYEVNRLSLSDFRIFGGEKATGVVAKARKFIDPYGSSAALLESIQKSLTTMSKDDLLRLQKAGIDISPENLADVRMRLSSVVPPPKGGTVGKVLSGLSTRGQMTGVAIFDDNAARVLSFDIGGKTLTGYQANLVLAMTGHSRIDAIQLASAIQAGDSAKLASIIEKMPKRERSALAPRDISLEGDELQTVIRKFMGKRQGDATLENVALFIDPQYDILKKFANQSYDFKGNKALQEYYAAIHQDYLAPFLEGYESKLSDDEMIKLKTAINNFSEGKNGSWLSDQLAEHLEKEFIQGNQTRGNVVNSLFKSLEQAWDSSDNLNKRFIDSYLFTLQDQKKTLHTRLAKISSDGNSSQELMREVNDIKSTIIDLDSKIRRIQGGDLSFISGRARIKVGQLGDMFRNMKTKFSGERIFEGKELSKYAFTISKQSLKAESGMFGEVSSLRFSEIGSGRDIVYEDPIAMAHHGEIFRSKEAVDAIKIQQQAVLEEYRQTLETGILPERIKKVLQMQANQDVDLLTGSKRLSGIRNKQFAEDIMRALELSGNVNNSPYVLQMISKMYATEAFREKITTKGMLPLSALPDTHRFAIDTEKSRLPTLKPGESPFKFGGEQGAFYGSEMINIKGEADSLIHARVGKFRVEGHNVLLPDHAAGVYHHSLGGFDLDDKGLARLVTYEDQKGMKRLGSYMFRQPTGPQEIIFKRMNMDQNTIRAMFGHEDFQNELNSLIDETDGISNPNRIGHLRLRELFDPESPIREIKGELENADEIEQAIVSVRASMIRKGLTEDLRLSDKAIEEIGKYGSSALKLKDIMQYMGPGQKPVHLAPQYTRQGLYNIMFGEGVFDMTEEVISTLEESGLDQSVMNNVRSAKNFDEMLQKINISMPTEEAQAVVAEAVNKMSRKKALEQGDILGVYINRSAVAGGMLDQYEEFLKNAPAGVREFLLDAKNIPYRIGLAPPESVIDPIVNLGGAKKLHQTTQDIISRYGGAMNEEKLSGVLQKLMGAENIQKAVSVNDLGTMAIESVGRIIGFSRAIGSENQDLLMGIDANHLVQRMSNTDRTNLLKQMRYGAQEALDKGFIPASMLTEAEKNIANYSAMSALPPEDTKVLEYLQGHIGLRAGHRFAYQASAVADLENTKRVFELMRRQSIASSTSDPILGMAKYSGQEESVATRIIEKHKKDLELLFGGVEKDINLRGQVEIDTWRMMKEKMVQDIYETIDQAFQIKDITKPGLLNALDNSLMPSNIDLLSVPPIMDEFNQPISRSAYTAFTDMQANRAVTRIKHYQSMDQANAEAVMAKLAPSGDKLTTDVIQERAASILDSTEEVSGLVRNTLQSLAGRGRDIESEIARKQAATEAEIIKSNVSAQTLKDTGVLNEMGTTDSLLLEGKIDDIADIEDGSNFDKTLIQARNNAFADYEDLTTSRGSAVYKRLTKDAMKNDFADLVTNPMMKKGLLAAGALVVGSFAYQGFKDRSKDDLAGPPLLPGGSSYEEGMPSRAPQMPLSGGQGYQAGTSYQVSIYGGRDKVGQFNKAAGNLVNGNINATMYNRIPDVGRDPYSSIASSY